MTGDLDILARDLGRVRCARTLSRLRARSLADHPGDMARDAVFALRMFEIKLASVTSIPELDGFVGGLADGLRFGPGQSLADCAPALAQRIAVRRAELMAGRR